MLDNGHVLMDESRRRPNKNHNALQHQSNLTVTLLLKFSY
jgi:hypothetical protein